MPGKPSKTQMIECFYGPRDGARLCVTNQIHLPSCVPGDEVHTYRRVGDECFAYEFTTKVSGEVS
jgi:hypothetical protein